MMFSNSEITYLSYIQYSLEELKNYSTLFYIITQFHTNFKSKISMQANFSNIIKNNLFVLLNYFLKLYFN